MQMCQCVFMCAPENRSVDHLLTAVIALFCWHECAQLCAGFQSNGARTCKIAVRFCRTACCTSASAPAATRRSCSSSCTRVCEANVEAMKPSLSAAGIAASIAVDKIAPPAGISRDLLPSALCRWYSRDVQGIFFAIYKTSRRNPRLQKAVISIYITPR